MKTIEQDADVIQGWLDGDEECFAELWRRYAGAVLRLSQRKLPKTIDAEEVVQRVFCILWQHGERMRGVRSLAGWVHVVTVRCCRDLRKTAGNRIAKEVPMNPAYDQETSTNHARDIIDDYLETLPAHEREAVAQVYFCGLTHEEAAQQLGCATGTVSARLHRAIKRLRTLSGATTAASLAALLNGGENNFAPPPQQDPPWRQIRSDDHGNITYLSLPQSSAVGYGTYLAVIPIAVLFGIALIVNEQAGDSSREASSVTLTEGAEGENAEREDATSDLDHTNQESRDGVVADQAQVDIDDTRPIAVTLSVNKLSEIDQFVMSLVNDGNLGWGIESAWRSLSKGWALRQARASVEEELASLPKGQYKDIINDRAQGFYKNIYDLSKMTWFAFQTVESARVTWERPLPSQDKRENHYPQPMLGVTHHHKEPDDEPKSELKLNIHGLLSGAWQFPIASARSGNEPVSPVLAEFALREEVHPKKWREQWQKISQQANESISQLSIVETMDSSIEDEVPGIILESYDSAGNDVASLQLVLRDNSLHLKGIDKTIITDPHDRLSNGIDVELLACIPQSVEWLVLLEASMIERAVKSSAAQLAELGLPNPPVWGDTAIWLSPAGHMQIAILLPKGLAQTYQQAIKEYLPHLIDNGRSESWYGIGYDDQRQLLWLSAQSETPDLAPDETSIIQFAHCREVVSHEWHTHASAIVLFPDLSGTGLSPFISIGHNKDESFFRSSGGLERLCQIHPAIAPTAVGLLMQ